MTIKEAKHIWMNGEMIPWRNANVHVLSHALHYGTSIFEGIRAYQTLGGTSFFRLGDHIARLFASAKIYRFELPFEPEELRQACHQVLAVNGLRDAYIRPIAFLGYGHIGLLPPLETQSDVAVIAFEWGSYLGQGAVENGVEVCVSSWQRVAGNTVPAMAKAGGNYLPARLISMDAKRAGYHEAIALDTNGFVSEGPGENLFLVKDNTLLTPACYHSVLPGITRDSVITLARSKGLQVQESTLPREMLYLADELFFTGTAAEVVPITAVDGVKVGSGRVGPVTRTIQHSFFGLFNGQQEDEWAWLEKSHFDYPLERAV